MKIERTKNATRNIIFNTLQKIYQLLVPFIMRTAMIYYMGVEYLGLTSLFTSVISVLNLAELGVGSAMVFSMYKPIAEDDHSTICALMRLYRTYYRVIGGAVALVGLALTPAIPKLVENGLPDGLNIYILYIMNLSITVLSYWMFAYKNCLISAFQRSDIASKVAMATSTVQYLLQFIIIVFIKDYYLYFFVAIITQIINNITTSLIVSKLFPNYKPVGKLDRKEIKVINQRVKDLFTAKLGYTIVNSADTIVISSFLGLEILAIYQNYYFIMSSVLGFVMIALNSCIAGIGNSLVTESMKKNYNDLKKISFLLSWINAFCVSCMLCIFQPFIKLWVGEKMMLPMIYVVLFCIYFFLYSTNQLLCVYKDSAGIWHSDRFRPLIAALFNLALNLLFVRWYGLFAIILSTILSYIMIGMPWLVHNIFTKLFKISPKEYICKQIIYVLVTVIIAILSYLLCSCIPGTGIINMILRVLLCAFISLGVYCIFMRKCNEYKSSLELINKMTKGKLSKILK